jgi:transposase
VPGNDVTPPAATPDAQAPSAPEAPSAEELERKRRKRRKKATPPAQLERRELSNPVPEGARTCPDCRVPMERFRDRSTSYFDLEIAKVVWVERKDEVLACPHCDAMACAPAPPGVLDGGKLGPTLVAEATYQKIVNALPIERQARDFQRRGAPILAGTLGRSVAGLLSLLVPLAKRIQQRVNHSERLQLDSTGLRVLDTTQPTGTWRDTLWVLIGDGRWVSFHALNSGDGPAFDALIAEAEADTFQCDGTSVTNGVEKKKHRCRPGCHAHCRRKLVEAVRRGDLRALEALELYSALFRIEHQADRAKLSPPQRAALRQEKSWPILEALRAWALALAPSVEPKSPLGAALTYMQNQWYRLCVFVVDGAIEPTNNRSERELRAWILGQNAWLFVGDQQNAERWCAGFSLLHTAVAQGLNPQAYLHAVARAVLPGHPAARLDELLPDAMLRAHPELADPLHRARASPPCAEELAIPTGAPQAA